MCSGRRISCDSSTTIKIRTSPSHGSREGSLQETSRSNSRRACRCRTWAALARSRSRRPPALARVSAPRPSRVKRETMKSCSCGQAIPRRSRYRRERRCRGRKMPSQRGWTAHSKEVRRSALGTRSSCFEPQSKRRRLLRRSKHSTCQRPSS